MDQLPLVVGLAPLVVRVAFLPPSGLAVTLGCLRVAKHLGGLGRLALGAGSPLVCGGCAVVRLGLAPDVLVVAGHQRSVPGGEPLVICWTELPLCTWKATPEPTPYTAVAPRAEMA